MPASPQTVDENAAAIVDATAAVFGLAIDPAWREGVVTNFAAIAKAAALVEAFPLDDELDPAPVFRA